MNVPTILLIGLGLAAATTAVVGVPKLLQRDQEIEAIRELAKLARTASVLYVKPRADETGGRMVCQFPHGEIRMAPAKSCCDPSVNNGHGLCDPAKIEWNRTLWNSLRFQLTEPQPYIFAYQGSGTLGQAEFTLSAYGDLDCDGHYSTFRFVGHGDAHSSAQECLLGQAPVFSAVDADE